MTLNRFSKPIDNTPTIGVAGVTIPGALDCIKKINLKSRDYFKEHEHPNIILHQLNFAPTYHAQIAGQWDIVEDRLVQSITTLANLNADFAIIPANTVHKVIDGIQRRSPIPVISLLDVVAAESKRLHRKKIGIMGTTWTMANHLYQAPLFSQGILEEVPSSIDQQIVQQAIVSELIPTEKVSEQTMTKLLGVVERLKINGCDAIALACTELPLVLNEKNCGIRVLDTNAILAEAAVKKSISFTK